MHISLVIINVECYYSDACPTEPFYMMLENCTFLAIFVSELFILFLIGFLFCENKLFSATGCGRNLGMITGDIKDYQIETSSNYKDIHHSRAMQGTEGWCSAPEDRDRWLMVSLKDKVF